MTIFAVRRGVSMTTDDEGTVLLDEHTGAYWQLNSSGSLVLSILLAGGTPQEATKQLADRYAIDHGRAAHDVTDLVNHLREAGLVTI
ncbi:lasso peptide biosynthesis PqqD family chaperone [Nocardia terpenica]|uniref:Lasso peptide biosynthesis PqqD family chaperone n=2 Tax=Nocardia terpenica TaxID=455432 RepID=A0A164LS70_9NOCA|nr:hypothetical protein AWN90_28375 [Nocardia terpenica]MBF6061414.1 lasso peptide biosynthesis PqqD family chaperone [Nocardia terpenica]MBF6105357.1 lasso peptide biosynthesis PqqD family chaperone [Nocardia terpenica]MBF6113173.1 lasso peptide biosynthesis PqqD family chaperone [Nocardia terpenica]MBF6119303.1 lasso peptide biosynthesis PqqD family chaperone [Nocardia terpenica]